MYFKNNKILTKANLFNLFPSSVQTDVTLQTCSVLTILQRTNHWNNIVQQTF